MQRLTGLDATFLSLETPASHMHVAGLMILDPATMPRGFSLEEVKDLYRQRLDAAPPFRRRLAQVPLGLHHPLWIEDPDFDLDWHIHHIAVPAPGGREQLADLVSHLNAIQLDRSRPLWEAWVIEGLADGNYAVLTKVHHAAMDGASGNELTVAILDLTPEIEQRPPPDEPWAPDKVPSELELLAYAANSLARQPWRVVKAARKTASAALRVRDRNRQPNVTPPPAPFSAPKTSFNATLTPSRSYAYDSLSLPLVKAIKNATGATVNDVVLALCSGALRDYLAKRGEELDASLVAMVPVSVRTEEQKGDMGNQVSSMLTTLATDVDDPLERLAVIHESMSEAKEQHQALGADTLQDWAEFAAPAVAGRAARLAARMKVFDRVRPFFNVTISNVPGPPFELYSAGARMVHNFPVGPINDGAGINITVMSYLDQLDFGIQACPDLVPDVWTICDGLRRSLDELAAAAGIDASELEKLSRIATG
jgi:WS/DGAT/MGAT family acyltransferase